MLMPVSFESSDFSSKWNKGYYSYDYYSPRSVDDFIEGVVFQNSNDDDSN
jgi:hypothetical protein